MFNILANGTRDGSYNLDYINDTVAEFGKKVQDGSKGTADAFADLSEETQGFGNHLMMVKQLQLMYSMLF